MRKNHFADSADEKNETRAGPCDCLKNKEKADLKEEEEREYAIKFENFLHNSLYKKRYAVTPLSA